MTERRAAAAATLLSSSSTGHRCFQEEYLEYSPCNDFPPSVRNEDRFPRRRRARGRNWREKKKKREEKNVGEETSFEMLRGANLCGRREAADDIFHEA